MTAASRLLVLAALLCAATAEPVHAQMGRFGGGRGGREAQQQTQTPAPPPPPVIPEVWPRLDPGAVLCRTEADLTRYQAQITGHATGGPWSPPRCRVIQATTAIKILDRLDPSQTKIELSDSAHQVGWTNVFLPARPPGP
jgi:hypothetical protein